jgi:hypothetical protein
MHLQVTKEMVAAIQIPIKGLNKPYQNDNYPSKMEGFFIAVSLEN